MAYAIRPYDVQAEAPPPVRAHRVRPESPSPEGAHGRERAHAADRAYGGERADAIRPYDVPAEPSPDPSLYTILNKRTVLAGWEQALFLLRPELPAAAYQSYLAPAQPLRWDPPDRLVISLPTPYQCEWVESRLKRSLERLLIGILAQGVSIDFICLAE
ncbi:MAG TPA: DnaA N-terminal domain-containing protein [Anaerolineales bacterium]|nr:DnaA N-terminal domain-containing protein [Anaerolineales bacterium]